MRAINDQHARPGPGKSALDFAMTRQRLRAMPDGATRLIGDVPKCTKPVATILSESPARTTRSVPVHTPVDPTATSTRRSDPTPDVVTCRLACSVTRFVPASAPGSPTTPTISAVDTIVRSAAAHLEVFAPIRRPLSRPARASPTLAAPERAAHRVDPRNSSRARASLSKHAVTLRDKALSAVWSSIARAAKMER